MNGVTMGLSPKAILATSLPAMGTLIALLISWGVTGEIDRQELVIALSGLSGSVLAGVGAWLGVPGMVRYEEES